MSAASVCVCVSFIVMSVSPHQNSPTFNYKTLASMYHWSRDDCLMCYGDHDCWAMDQPRCEYYMEADRVTQQEDEEWSEEEIKLEVDSLMFDLVEQAPTQTECLPYISYFTNCTKENICLGCKTCTCTEQGSWNCSVEQKCQPDAATNIDHRMLVMVIEKLMNDKKRTRRSVTNTETTAQPRILTYEELSEWLYGEKPYVEPIISNATEPNNATTDYNVTDTARRIYRTRNATHTTDSITTPADQILDELIESDYIAFDEVLNSITNDNKIYNRRKPLEITQNDSINIDMNIEKHTITDNALEPFMNILNAIEYAETTKSTNVGVTEVVIDLLEYVKQNAKEYNNVNKTDYMEMNNKVEKDINSDFHNANNEDFNTIHITKREISPVTEHVDITAPQNISDTIEDLKNNVLLPLDKIIEDKRKEIEELLHIRDNLLKYIETSNSTNVDLNWKYQKALNNTNPYFSIYKLEITPQQDYEYDLRRNNPNLFDKFLYKLKRDIYEVIRDIVGIQKLTSSHKLPNDLKFLIRALKHYIRNDSKETGNENPIQIAENTRRHNSFYNYNPKNTKKYIVEILEVLERHMPLSNALAPLSPISKKIMKRVIKQNYIDDSSVVGFKVNDLLYNLTNDLNNIGTKWQIIVTDVAKSSIFNQLYLLKLLHFVLSADTTKISSALEIIDFAYSRRMIPKWETIGEEMLEKIHNGLSAINDKIRYIIKHHMKNRNAKKEHDINTFKDSHKKESFLKHIRNLLKGSKKDISNLLHKKLPKSQIVKELAKMKLDEITKKRLSQYEDTMRRWQNNLNITPTRQKRSAVDLNKLKQRIKNIIPNYLRGKVNPAIAAKDSKKKNIKKNNKDHSKKRKVVNTTAKSKTTVKMNSATVTTH